MGRPRQSMPSDNVGRLYLIGLTDGRIKVGRACHVAKRVKAHMSQHREVFAWAHIFGGSGGGDAESLAILMLSQAGCRVGRSESFTGIDKAAAIHICRQAVMAQLQEREQVVHGEEEAI